MSATRPGSEVVNRIVAVASAPTSTSIQPLPSPPTTARTVTSNTYSSVRPNMSVTWSVTEWVPGLANVWVTTGPSSVATTDSTASRIVHSYRTMAPVDPRPSNVAGRPTRTSTSATAAAPGGARSGPQRN